MAHPSSEAQTAKMMAKNMFLNIKGVFTSLKICSCDNLSLSLQLSWGLYFSTTISLILL